MKRVSGQSLELITVDGDEKQVKEFIAKCRAELNRLEKSLTLKIV